MFPHYSLSSVLFKRFLGILLSILLVNVAEAKSIRLSKSDKAEIEQSILQAMKDCKTMGLSIVFVKGDKIVYQNAFGYRDKETNDPLKIDNIFRIASISKSFSGMSIMQLVEAGKIRLDDDVNDIIGMNIRNPRYPDIPITIKMLLSHTSSMKDGLGGSKVYADLKYIDEKQTSKEKMLTQSYETYAPGKGYKYCNRALNLIGLIIEKVSGERFDNYVRNHILRPAGINGADFNQDSLNASLLTTLYTYDEKKDTLLESESKGHPRICEVKIENGTYKIAQDGCYWSPTGGMKSSAPELAKWMMTLRDGGVGPNGKRIISKALCDTMLTPVINTGEGTSYCLTTRTEPRFIEGVTLKGHTGSARGLKSCMFFNPASDWGFVCLCSSSNGETENGVRKVYYRAVNAVYAKLKDKL